MKPALVSLAALLVLAACQNPGAPVGLWGQATSPTPGTAVAVARPSADGPEAACSAQAEAQGLTVRGVAAARDVTDADGAVTGRDVMLNVMRGQQVYNVRCNYSYETSEARIMSL